MSSIAEGDMTDPRRSLDEFNMELESAGIEPIGDDLGRRLWLECAGRARFATSVLRAAAAAGVGLDLESETFADWVAALCPPLSLATGPGEKTAAAVLAHLSAVSEVTALRALTAVADDLRNGSGFNDPEGMIERLQSNGIIIWVSDAVRGTLLQVPTLIAAKLRYDLGVEADASSVVASLLEVLIEHMESVGTTEAELVGDVLLLARRGRHWPHLLRVSEAVGIPMFLLAPSSACTAFRFLPPKVRADSPGLEFFGTLAEGVTSDATNADAAQIRAAVMRYTGPGMLRSRLPGIAEDVVDQNPERRQDSGQTATRPGAERTDAGSADFIGTIRTMTVLADAGRHSEAAEIGIYTAAKMRSARARSIVRLLTAIALHHSVAPRRALSLLNDIEGPTRAGHIDGDFLLPAIVAWTALISAVSGDHERADEHLAATTAPSRLRRAVAEADSAAYSKSQPNVIIDELVTPPLRIASALRALDRLDLVRARSEFDALSAYPEMRTLWVYLPFIARTLAVLTAETESGLLFVNDDAERFRDSGVLSESEKDLLVIGRSIVFIALGQLQWAEIDRERLSPTCDSRIVLGVRSKLIAGRNEEAISCADAWFYHRSLSPRSRAELAAIRAAAELRNGDEKAASADFTMALSFSSWVSSLLPIALLPLSDRERLVDLVPDSTAWAEAASEFSDTFDSPADLKAGLRTVGPASVDVALVPQLNAGEAQLIDYLVRGLTVAEIAVELQQVTGTVKNRLSALYHKFGVTNRAEVLSRARSFGYLSRTVPPRRTGSVRGY